ncbi:uncharacterized protein BJ171DRAFT_460964 [Polychytrium aggregatum]|uniref:uncharacterized protein n=1 Tax=Polychytrium aggregatum TaxID=110093 RepID=UPI0022FE7576|nr:uncharacterized protein BJ171DRAFT_460964 [Polychytrium aggregatum]KAI9202868.1 hypothetical protein BJ171DRAFT_460964 [Polychytrium aggregatum]
MNAARESLASEPFEQEPARAPEYTVIVGLRFSSFRHLLFYAASLASLGILPLVAKFNPRVWSFCRARVDSFRDAEYILVRGLDGSWSELKVCRAKAVESTGASHARRRTGEITLAWFEYRKVRYVYSEETRSFQRHSMVLQAASSAIHAMAGGLTTAQVQHAQLRNGKNKIEIESPTVLEMIADKIIHPIYLFQLAAMVIWIVEEYYTYSLLIWVMTVSSIAWEIYGAKRNERNLKRLIVTQTLCRAYRDGKVVEINSEELVVGDAVVIDRNDGSPITCDMALIQGDCVVDESKLTGESIPVEKTCLPVFDEEGAVFYSSDVCKKHTIYSGSSILCNETNGWSSPTDCVGNGDALTIGIVVATGFESNKGELFRNILYPAKVDLKFNRDALHYMGLLGFVAVVILITRIVTGALTGKTFVQLLMNCLDIVTIAIPPALPLVLTIGVGISVGRLKDQKIFCISPLRVLFSGRINIMCWDKTGTLTIPSLEWVGCDPVRDSSAFGGVTRNVDMYADLFRVMLTCHSLVYRNEEIVGSSIDREMFGATKAKLKYCPSSINIGIGIGIENATVPAIAQIIPDDQPAQDLFILKRYDFHADMQRSAVVFYVKDSNQIYLSVKGSPEALRGICAPSTVPKQYYLVHRRFASQGFYVIACAIRNVTEIVMKRGLSQLNGLQRSVLEQDLQFTGFCLFDNRVRDETPAVIGTLNNAKIKSVIITGDNPLTAIHVARQLELTKKVLLIDLDESGEATFHTVEQISMDDMDGHDPATPVLTNPEDYQKYPIEELPQRMTDEMKLYDLTMTGRALDRIIQGCQRSFIKWIINRTKIFARATPTQKGWIVSELINQGNFVAMCGDGTNDCGALKAAHVGLALSDSEASVVSPFTSVKKSISDMVRLLCEGQCALETSFSAFKYMTLYPIIQVTMTASLLQLSSALSNNEFLFDDVLVVLIPAVLMLYTGPNTHLTSDRPTENLLGPLVLSSLIGQIAICTGFFFINLKLLQNQPWYCSAERAVFNLDRNWLPINPLLPSYLCYPISPVDDTSQGNLLRTYENTGVWLFSHFQYIFVIVAFTASSRYRRPLWTNIGYFLYLIFIVCFLTAMLVVSDSDIDSLSNGTYYWRLFPMRKGVSQDYRFGAWILATGQFALSVGWEILGVQIWIKHWVQIREGVAQLKKEAKIDYGVGYGESIKAAPVYIRSQVSAKPNASGYQILQDSLADRWRGDNLV